MNKILGGVQVIVIAAGCAGATGDDGRVSLPGDIDDAGATALDGKADAWNGVNDPRRLSQTMNYRLAELPLTGAVDRPVWADRYAVKPGDAMAWADTYWPTSEGSTNARWQGADVKSPLEKYDAVFNGVAGCDTMPDVCGEGSAAEWATYNACAGPAAKWQSESFQNGVRMHDGRDNDGDGEIDECGSDNDGIAGWWGLCHSWAPAALLEPEPLKAVTYDGVEFAVADIKALIITYYDATVSLGVGGRCNAQEIDHDDTGRATASECRDVNPGTLHVVLTNFIGINDGALVEDRTANYEVWNQPVLGYEITKQELVEPAAAAACVGATDYDFNAQAVELYEVEIRVDYLTEGSASTSPLGQAAYTRNDNYHYILEVDDRGKIIGGEYCESSKLEHPDFLWAPTSAGADGARRNPHVDFAKVSELLRLSRE